MLYSSSDGRPHLCGVQAHTCVTLDQLLQSLRMLCMWYIIPLLAELSCTTTVLYRHRPVPPLLACTTTGLYRHYWPVLLLACEAAVLVQRAQAHRQLHGQRL